MRLYLVRHAEPAYPEDALTETGHRQAEALARHFAAEGLDHLASSPLERARATARPIAAALGLPLSLEPWAAEVEDWWIPGGPWGEQPVWQVEPERLRALRPDRPWYEQPPFDLPRLGEGYRERMAGADAFLASLRAAGPPPERVALVCHEGLGLTWLARLLGRPAPAVWAAFRLAPGSVTTVEVGKSPHPPGQPRGVAPTGTMRLDCS
jgi:broad specificity phosphatase PhoE